MDYVLRFFPFGPQRWQSDGVEQSTKRDQDDLTLSLTLTESTRSEESDTSWEDPKYTTFASSVDYIKLSAFEHDGSDEKSLSFTTASESGCSSPLGMSLFLLKSNSRRSNFRLPQSSSYVIHVLDKVPDKNGGDDTTRFKLQVGSLPTCMYLTGQEVVENIHHLVNTTKGSLDLRVYLAWCDITVIDAPKEILHMLEEVVADQYYFTYQ
jgi:hypothetical protein